MGKKRIEGGKLLCCSCVDVKKRRKRVDTKMSEAEWGEDMPGEGEKQGDNGGREEKERKKRRRGARTRTRMDKMGMTIVDVAKREVDDRRKKDGGEGGRGLKGRGRSVKGGRQEEGEERKGRGKEEKREGRSKERGKKGGRRRGEVEGVQAYKRV